MKLWTENTYEPCLDSLPGSPVFRAKGYSYWHWVYAHNGQSFGFYNTAEQAQAALDKKLSNGQ